MNKKAVTSVRAGSVKELCEAIQEAYNLGFMIEVYQFSESVGAYNPNLFIVDLFIPVKEGTE
ncbi:hypothetical protein BV582_21540 [Bacillus paralicheniformis]|uniref:hypothetical protein n=1 Tax=Bacillus paralicheniformis TaxID=1648923 RepID=UPI000C773082|nr:hypothetical protein [Bacillus paralicheniformis]PLC14155.1 hypothetical protein BV582_21540 [Bacillus paralicheniformis]